MKVKNSMMFAIIYPDWIFLIEDFFPNDVPKFTRYHLPIFRDFIIIFELGVYRFIFPFL